MRFARCGGQILPFVISSNAFSGCHGQNLLFVVRRDALRSDRRGEVCRGVSRHLGKRRTLHFDRDASGHFCARKGSDAQRRGRQSGVFDPHLAQTRKRMRQKEDLDRVLFILSVLLSWSWLHVP